MLSKMQFLSEDRSFKSGKEGSRVLKRRKRFTPWLEEQINQGGIDGLEWIDKDIGLFKVPWMRVDKPDFVLETDAELFKRWAEHTGKYRRGDQPDPSTWKTRFRCALRKMREIVEVKELGRLEGNKPYRAFRFKPKLKERSAPLTCSANKVNTIESNNSTGVSVIDVPMDPWVSRRQNA